MATSHCIKQIVDVNLSRQDVFALCRKHHILAQHFRCFWRFAARAEIKSETFGNKIVFCDNYRRVVDFILEAAARASDDAWA